MTSAAVLSESSLIIRVVPIKHTSIRKASDTAYNAGSDILYANTYTDPISSVFFVCVCVKFCQIADSLLALGNVTLLETNYCLSQVFASLQKHEKLQSVNYMRQ